MSYNHFDDINGHLDKIRKSLSPYNIDVELLPGTKKNEVTGENNYTLRYTSQEGQERMRGILAAQKSKAERRDVDPSEITNEELRDAHNGYTYISERVCG